MCVVDRATSWTALRSTRRQSSTSKSNVNFSFLANDGWVHGVGRILEQKQTKKTKNSKTGNASLAFRNRPPCGNVAGRCRDDPEFAPPRRARTCATLSPVVPLVSFCSIPLRGLRGFKPVFCCRSDRSPRDIGTCGVGWADADGRCSRPPQDFGPIVGQLRRRLRPRFEPTCQVAQAVPSRKAAPLG